MKLSIQLSLYDWSELVHFVEGDIANMDETCLVRKQMKRICKKIRLEIA